MSHKKSLESFHAEKRSTFSKKLSSIRLLGCSIIFIDESGFTCGLPKTQGGLFCFGVHDWGISSCEFVSNYS
ncbi:hypothetical protein [Holospora undulata]|uniref:hypothetical protein n=1 Tax=Holospora undulata TaxID=1169117 RepID=UPI00039C0EBF|nr:hypothetical protein [Holospora undulata]